MHNAGTWLGQFKCTSQTQLNLATALAGQHFLAGRHSPVKACRDCDRGCKQRERQENLEKLHFEVRSVEGFQY